MCVIFLYVNSNPEKNGYKLILASNRDEFYSRKTLQAGKWLGEENVYGGVDLERGREGGTWLAISGKDGTIKIGALLNLTGEPKPKNVVGRGMIVTDYVRNYSKDFNITNYNQHLVEDCSKYSAFNFVSIEINSILASAAMTVCSNLPAGLAHYKEKICYGFGNSLPSCPFEKVSYGRNAFQNIIDNYCLPNVQHQRTELVANLLNLLKCKTKFWPDLELKRRAPLYGEHLSALNVSIPETGYGSRTHTVILLDANNKMDFIEETMISEDPDGKWSQTHMENQFFSD